MAHNSVIERPVLELIPNDISGLRILDIAFGYGFIGYSIRVFKKGVPYLIGVDVWKPHVIKQSTIGLYDEVHVIDVRCGLPFPDNSIDIVLACEIIEHLDKEDANLFLLEIERVSKNIIIVTTPYGFMKQDALYGNINEIHRSAWFPDELREKGYSVKLYDGRIMTRSMKVIDMIRRFICRLQSPLFIVGYKKLKYNDSSR